MASTIIDSAIFQGIFSSDAMRQVWSDENRTAKYLDIEAALASVQGRLGLIPQEAADEIVSHCRLDQIDMVKLRASRPSASATRSSAWSRSSTRCAATSSANTATGARPRRTSPTPRRCCRSAKGWRSSTPTSPRSRRQWPSWRARYRDTPMIGRSNLQQAIPVTFGYKMAGLGDRAPPRAPRAAAPARAGRRVRRRRGHARVAGDRGDGNAGRPDAPSSAWASR